MDGKDVVWLDGIEEIGVLSIPKVFAWWRLAAGVMEHFTHAVKVDDDSFVNVPNLLRALPVGPRDLCFGALAHAGYYPEPKFRMCGWSWNKNFGAWRRLKCEQRGFSVPNAFPLGALQVLSRALVLAVGTSRAVQEFSDAANLSADLRARDSNEDVALGYWLARLSRESRSSGTPLNVTYVSVNHRVPNLGCFRNGGLYKQATRDPIVIHRIKGHAGMGYVWRRLYEGAAHDPLLCARAAEIELPKGATLFSPSFEAKLKAGTAWLHFDQKTNRLTMGFGTPRSASIFESASGLFWRGNRSATAPPPPPPYSSPPYISPYVSPPSPKW